jgi:hypothetical protein
MVMKVALLQFDSAIKQSLISKSGAETQVNTHPTGGNLTTQHTHDL